MILSANISMVAPILRTMVLNGTRTFTRLASAACYNAATMKPIAVQAPHRHMLSFANLPLGSTSVLSNKILTSSVHSSSEHSDDAGSFGSLHSVLEREIQDEKAELDNQLSLDGMPGFTVTTDGAEVKLTKKHGPETINVIFNVSSSLHEWVSPADRPGDNSEQKQQDEGAMEDVQSDLVSMPDFQVQVVKGKQTLEFSCFFVEAEPDEQTGEVYNSTAEFDVHELVLYEGEPKSSEFAVSTEYFNEELQGSLLAYLSERGIDEEFARNLVHFATSYEKKQYIDMMEKLKTFVK